MTEKGWIPTKKKRQNDNKSFGDRIIERLEDFNKSLRDGDDACEKYTTRKVHLDLDPMPYDPNSVKQARELMRMSQSVFAGFLGVATKTVQAWEQGKNTPPKMACRFMDLMRSDPEYWRSQFRNLVNDAQSSSPC